MRHRVDRLDKQVTQPPPRENDSLQVTRTDRTCDSSRNNNHQTKHPTTTMVLSGLEALEMESDHEEEHETLAPSSTSSSPWRERTRAAHHNGSLPTPPASTASSFPTTITAASSIVVSTAKSTPSHFIRYVLLTLFGICITIYLVPQPDIPSSNGSTTQLASRGRQRPRPKVSYSCPITSSSSNNIIDKPQNRDDATHGKWYDQVSQQWQVNFTSYLSIYRQVEFDNWGLTYEQVKKSMRDWKVRMYAPVVNQNPDRVYRIYESACGIGLNLALTTEILSETTHMKRVEVYGNDYVEASIQLAERLYDEGRIVENYRGRMGRFCAADSTNLQHVPSDSFDIVFTGYITPLTDPLHVAHKYDTPRDVERAYQAICENKTNPEAVQQMQDAQEDFFKQWVSEMIRIARPNAPVIVEQVSLPLCEAYYDWGGVSRDFWNRTVQNEWPVNAESLVFEDDTIMKGRYHVSFRKNK